MPAKILYKITWNRPGEPDHTALAVYKTVEVIRAALLETGYAMAVSVCPAEAPADRSMRADYSQALRDAAEMDDAGGLDSGDRTAMGRLGARAFPHLRNKEV